MHCNSGCVLQRAAMFATAVAAAPHCGNAAAQLTSPSGRKSAVQDWEDPGSGQFNVRSRDYLRNKKKELSEAAIYKCTPPL